MRKLARTILALLASRACLGCSNPMTTPAGNAPVSGRTALGGHALVTHDQNQGTSPASTAPITTRPTGSLLLAISMGRIPNYAVPTDRYNNSWRLLGKRNTYAHGPFFTAMWASPGARGGPGHTLSATKSADAADEISLGFIEIENATLVRDGAYAYPQAGQHITPGTVTVDGPATLVAVWGGDASELTHSATPSDGFEVIDSYLVLGPTSGVQIAIATKQVTSAGNYSVTWTSTPKQGAACYLLAIQ